MKSYEITVLSGELEEKYTQFVDMKKESFMYYSLKYRRLLTELLGDESEYLVAVDSDGNVIGCLPIFFKSDEETGTVANSLPFYGGHGGVLADSSDVRKHLLDAYIRVIKKRNCAASTIVGSPLEDYDALYKDKIQPTFIDERIELMTYFPYNELSADEALMGIYHYKTRNAIRKAIKSDVKIQIDNSIDAMQFLYNVHRENMTAIGGIPKEKRFFELLASGYEAGSDYDIYVAYRDAVRIGAMLVIYFNKTVEYYTPVIVSEYRNRQPLSLIIYKAMQDAMKKKMEKWNWGGTGLTQSSLYTFKSRWGTTETRYYYYTKIWNQRILEIPKEEVLKRYQNYYVYPFHLVNAEPSTVPETGDRP